MSNSESVSLLAESVGEVAENPTRSRKRSIVWQYFQKLPNEGKAKLPNEGKAQCIHCSSKLSYHKGIGTSHPQNHIRTACKEFPEDIDRSSIFPKSVSTIDLHSFVLDPNRKFCKYVIFAVRKCELGLEFALFRQRSRPHRSRRLEADTYLDDSLVPSREGEEFDVLRWWRRNQDQYLVLARMAHDFLAIPLSTVASESTFSTAGVVIDKYRNSLNSEIVEALICVKDWLKVYLSDDEDDDGVITVQEIN
ncbi:unnamed protein product [Urochloa decumbens]|uniref:BED-type domain-containing protein n=1 Tax=Urochloa decumbens TaxID=240449 RepID=A0ABC9HA94_9POAL